MSIGELGSLGELIAALATLVTLIYLSLQIKQNTAVHKIQALQYVMESSLNAHASLSADESERDIFERGSHSYTNLSQYEKDRFGMMVARMFSSMEFVFTSYGDNLVKLGSYEAAQRKIQFYIGHNGVAEWWEEEKWNFADDFQGEVERLARAEQRIAP